MSVSQKPEKIDKRAKALRDNLRKRKQAAKAAKDVKDNPKTKKD